MGDIFTYAEIPRKVFDIFIISVGSCMRYMFVQKGDYLFYSNMASMRPSLNDSLFAVLLPINFSVGR